MLRFTTSRTNCMNPLITGGSCARDCRPRRYALLVSDCHGEPLIQPPRRLNSTGARSGRATTEPLQSPVFCGTPQKMRPNHYHVPHAIILPKGAHSPLAPPRQVVFTDLQNIIIVELPKMPEFSDGSAARPVLKCFRGKDMKDAEMQKRIRV
jgi:hypothetical protein